VQENRLWMLQCRTGKRTGKAAVKIAVDLVSEGLVDTRSAIKMVDPGHLDQLLHPQVCNLIIICKSSLVGIRTTNSIQH
jgi:pyruvate, orthophosphate dikinase